MDYGHLASVRVLFVVLKRLHLAELDSIHRVYNVMVMVMGMEMEMAMEMTMEIEMAMGM